MHNYHIELYEIRLSMDDADDVALFNVTREEDGATWRVPAYLSPLFRILMMGSQPSEDSRQVMVIGLGARAIAERLEQGLEPPFESPLIFGTDYPGAPGVPNPLVPFEPMTVRT